MNKIPLNQAVMPYVRVFSNRADYARKIGHESPPYDPNLPVKIWDYIGPSRTINFPNVQAPSSNPYAGSYYNLVIREIVNGVHGVPTLESIFIPNFVALRVNIPPDQSGIAVDDQQFPIRDLRNGERIEAGFGGTPMIVQG